MIATAVATPFAAASPCPNLNTVSNWTVATSGPLVQTGPLFANQFGGDWIALSQRNAESYLSVGDNAPNQNNPGAVTIRISTTFQARAGVTYNLNFLLRAWGAEAVGQTVVFNIGGTTLFSAATKAGMGPTLVIGDGVERTLNLSWTATTTGPTTAEFVFTLPKIPTGVSPTNDDIRVTLPLITNTVC
ncbi:hypothetical protein [Pseudoclavibacter terrae]|uniref:hypothetical protein n=1 Tax=Pseudoclavibacter terrae TaxID=1530195 RepID=UPI00232F2A73|nr:hypothetical protein [Pseudoclavibacter terrae]